MIPQFATPEFNATLNAASGVLLVVGYLAIRRRFVVMHVAFMTTALAVSAVFLASYLYYHFTVGHVEFGHQYQERHDTAPAMWLARTYLIILLTHTFLAVTVAPLAIITASFGVLGIVKRSPTRLLWHRRIGYWTLPIWLYVSITGVVVYAMVYQL
jgi:putative membrane protein